MIEMTEDLLRVRDLGEHLLDMPVVELQNALLTGFGISAAILAIMLFFLWRVWK